MIGDIVEAVLDTMDDNGVRSCLRTTPETELRRSSRLSGSRSSNASDKLSSPDASSPSVISSSAHHPLPACHVLPIPSNKSQATPKQIRGSASPFPSTQTRPSPLPDPPFPATSRKPPIPAMTSINNHNKLSPIGIGVMNQSPMPFHPLGPDRPPTIPENNRGNEELRRFQPANTTTATPALYIPVGSKKNYIPSPCDINSLSRANGETVNRSPMPFDDFNRSNRYAEILSGYTSWPAPMNGPFSQYGEAFNGGETIRKDNHENYNDVNNGSCKYTTNHLAGPRDIPDSTKGSGSSAQTSNSSSARSRYRSKSRRRDDHTKDRTNADTQHRERCKSVQRGCNYPNNLNKSLSMHKVRNNKGNVVGSHSVQINRTSRVKKMLDTPIEEPTHSNNAFKIIAVLVLMVALLAICMAPGTKPIQNTHDIIGETKAKGRHTIAVTDCKEPIGNEINNNSGEIDTSLSQSELFNENIIINNNALLQTEEAPMIGPADRGYTELSALVKEEAAESDTAVEEKTPSSIVSEGVSAQEVIVIEYNDICFPDNHAELIMEPGVPMYLDSVHFELPSIPLFSNPRTLDLLISEAPEVNSYSPLIDWKTSFAERLHPKCDRELSIVDFHEAYRIFAEPVEAWVDIVKNAASWVARQPLFHSILWLPFLSPLIKQATPNNITRLYHSHLRFGEVCPDRGSWCYCVARLMLEHPGYNGQTPKSPSIGESSLSHSLNQVGEFISGTVRKGKHPGQIIQSFEVANLFPKLVAQGTNENNSKNASRATQDILISRIGFVITSNYGASNTCIHKLKAVGRRPYENELPKEH